LSRLGILPPNSIVVFLKTIKFVYRWAHLREKLSPSTGMNTIRNSNSVTGYFLKCFHVEAAPVKRKLPLRSST